MKSLKYTILLYCYFHLLSADGASGQNSTVTLSPDWSYCWEFTWFGPEYDNLTRYNGSCGEYLDDTRAKNIPCSDPLVITYNGTPPDMNYLWRHHRNSVLCRRGSTQMCAKYTYKLNGIVSNATYMCTKVRTSGAKEVSEGCYKEMNQGYEVELCLCKSSPGIYKPCNGAYDISAGMLAIGLAFVLFILIQ